MSSTYENAESLRKKLKAIQARISKAANEKIEAQRDLEVIENKCPHKWGSPEPVMVNKKPVKDKFFKKCSTCGMEKQSTGVQIKF